MPPLKHTIFIVDDDADDRESIRDAFMQNKLPQEINMLESGNGLLEKLRTSPALPSLILLDLNMPGKDGREILEEIKTDKELRHIPVIVLTTSSSAREKNTAYKLGANCFVTKPDTFTQFINITDSITRLWLNAS
jgi:CheY-like chemotaxis protein